MVKKGPWTSIIGPFQTRIYCDQHCFNIPTFGGYFGLQSPREFNRCKETGHEIDLEKLPIH
jgi:hypothetical protein